MVSERGGRSVAAGFLINLVKYRRHTFPIPFRFKNLVHILSRQRRENYDSKEGKIESKAEDGDPVPIFPVSPPVRIEWVSLPL